MSYLSQTHEKAIDALKNGHFDQALLLINDALEINKKHPVLLAERGTIYMYLKQKENALEDMDLALYLEPEKPYRYSSRAYVKDFFGDTEDAIEDYEKCLELDPKDVIAMNNLGLLIEKKGNLKKAQRYFKETDDLLKQNPDWQNRIATEDQKVQNNDPKENADTLINTSSEKQSNYKKTAAIARDVFTKKSVFREFIQFIRNGFKIKP